MTKSVFYVQIKLVCSKYAFNVDSENNVNFDLDIRQYMYINLNIVRSGHASSNFDQLSDHMKATFMKIFDEVRCIIDRVCVGVI
jgi:hypothetical protein